MHPHLLFGKSNQPRTTSTQKHAAVPVRRGLYVSVYRGDTLLAQKPGFKEDGKVMVRWGESDYPTAVVGGVLRADVAQPGEHCAVRTQAQKEAESTELRERRNLTQKMSKGSSW